MSESSNLPASSWRVVIICQGKSSDVELALELEWHLEELGFSVFLDWHFVPSMDWAGEITRQIRCADAVVALLSAGSVCNELFVYEVETAHETAQAGQGRPSILPVRIRFADVLPAPLSAILDVISAPLWEDNDDTRALVGHLADKIRQCPVAAPVRIVAEKGLRLATRPALVPRPKRSDPVADAGSVPRLETVGGAVPLNSEFYVVRSADKELREGLVRTDSILLIKGARQMGKTSLLARGLQFARERGSRVALTDFQKFNVASFESLATFYLSLAESLADELDLGIQPADFWDNAQGPNLNFERFVKRQVLRQMHAPLVWGMDEVDRLFVCPFGGEVFGLFRSWHNERAFDPVGPWAGMTLAMAYATEAHLFISDLNQSPFNVGTRLALDDFNGEQIEWLNRRHGGPLKSEGERECFIEWVAGHPYLVRRGFYEMTRGSYGLEAFEREARKDEGIYSDHLRRMLILLARDLGMTEALRQVLEGGRCPTMESFYRLRSAGVISGDTQNAPRMRCRLYEEFFRRHLLEGRAQP